MWLGLPGAGGPGLYLYSWASRRCGHDEAYSKLPLTDSNVHQVGHYVLCVTRYAGSL